MVSKFPCFLKGLPEFITIRPGSDMIHRWLASRRRLTGRLPTSSEPIMPFLVAVLCILFPHAVAAELSRAGSGEMRLYGLEDDKAVAATLLDTQVHIVVQGMQARVSVEQSFLNPARHWSDAVYVFPLPDDAAVSAMEMVIGERRVTGGVRERMEAQSMFRRASEEGRRAGLLEQQRPNLFTTRVSNIGPGERVTVRLEYVQAVQYREGEFSLRFPMTITARYVPGSPLPKGKGQLEINPEGWGVSTDEVPDARAITPFQHPAAGTARRPVNPVSVTADIDVGLPLASVGADHHDLRVVSREEQRYQLALTGTTFMDRDLLLRWRPVASAEPQLALFSETSGSHQYLMLMLVPPGRSAPLGLDREVVFVLDTSGSMGGEPIRQARRSLVAALSELAPQDRFNIIAFNSSARRLFTESVPADRHHLAQAAEFIRHLDPGGGTEMMPALELALSPADETPVGAGRLRQVVFITDGAVGNEMALFEHIQRRLGNSRLFTVGIGAAPNSWFMRKAAAFGRGQFTYVADAAETGERMAELFKAMNQPRVTDISVRWPIAVQSQPAQVPDLYQGEPLVVVARSEVIPSGTVTVSGNSGGERWQREVSLNTLAARAKPGRVAGIAMLWARRRIETLLDEKVLGRPEAEVRAEILPLALEQQLVSPYTSFVAVEEQVSRPAGEVSHLRSLPNARPAGQAPQLFAYPRTGTDAAARILLGGALLLTCLLFGCAVRLERPAAAVNAPLG
jgi:Ca-activated chloride channel family protein